MADQKVYQIKVDVIGDKSLQEFQRAIKKMNTNARASRKSLQSMEKGLKGIDGSLKATSAKLKSFSSLAKGAFAFLGVSFGARAIQNVVEMNSALAKTARTVGLTAEQFQAYQQSAKLAGINQSQLESSMTAFVKRVGEAKAGMGAMVGAFKNYNPELLKSIQNSKTQDQALKAIADAMKNAGSASEKAYIANAAFNRSGIAMVEWLQNGASALDEATENAKRMGSIISNESIAAAEEFDDKLEIMKTRMNAVFGQAAIDTMTFLFDNIRRGWIDVSWSFQQGLRIMDFGIRKLASVMRHAFPIAINSVKDAFAGLVLFVADGMEKISKISFSAFGKSVSFEMPGMSEAISNMRTFADGVQTSNTSAKQLNAELERINKESEIMSRLITQEREQSLKRIELEKEYLKLKRQEREIRGQINNFGDQAATGGGKEIDEYTKRLNSFRSSLLSSQMDADQLGEKIEILNQLFREGKISLEIYDNALDSLVKQTNETKENVKTLGDEMKVAFGQTLSDGVGRLVDNIMDANASFKDFAKSFIKDATAMIAKLIILNTIKNQFGGFGGLIGAAQGGVFEHGVQTYATGGVVSRPTFFPMAKGNVGLMGEAGPEAIMPLTRTSGGDLGVKTEVSVNVKNYAGVDVRTSQNGNDIDIIINRITADIVRGGTKVSRAMETAYGVNRVHGSI